MTYHINTSEYKCKNCDTIFVAYSKDLECPNCNTPEQSDGKSYGFIDEILHSMYIHKQQFGTYRPPVWSQASYSDYLQGVCFDSFDLFESNPGDSLDTFLDNFYLVYLENKSAENKHIQQILAQVGLKYHLIDKSTQEYKNRGWFGKWFKR